MVAPGSFVDLPDGTGRYEVIYDRPPAPLPEWLAALLDRARPRAPPLECRPAAPGQVRDLAVYAKRHSGGRSSGCRAQPDRRPELRTQQGRIQPRPLIAAGALTDDLAERRLHAPRACTSARHRRDARRIRAQRHPRRHRRGQAQAPPPPGPPREGRQPGRCRRAGRRPRVHRPVLRAAHRARLHRRHPVGRARPRRWTPSTPHPGSRSCHPNPARGKPARWKSSPCWCRGRCTRSTPPPPRCSARSPTPPARRTILFDEIDTIFGPKAKEHEELRGLLNAGHRRSGVAYRCVGEGTKQTVVEFPAYAAVALAGLGKLPDTILTRSIVIRMRRRAPDEHVEPYRARVHEPEGWKLRGMLADWTATAAEQLTGYWPEMPPGVTDRPADVWEPLLAVADAAGGPWPDRARDACTWLVRGQRRPRHQPRHPAPGRPARHLRRHPGHDHRRHPDPAARPGRRPVGRPQRPAARRPRPGPPAGPLRDHPRQGQGRRPLTPGLPRRAPRRRLDPLPPAAYPAEAEPAEPPEPEPPPDAQRFRRFRNPGHPPEPARPAADLRRFRRFRRFRTYGRRTSQPRPGAQPPSNSPGPPTLEGDT